MSFQNTEQRNALAQSIRNAFQQVARPVPINQEYENALIAVEELYNAVPMTNLEAQYESTVQAWGTELTRYDSDVVFWALPRLMCGVLRDGILNAPELIAYLNLTDTPFLMSGEHWPRFVGRKRKVLSGLNPAQTRCVIDWLVMMQEEFSAESIPFADLEAILDLTIDDWRERLHKSRP